MKGDADIAEILDGKQLIISFITELELLSMPELSEKEITIISELIQHCQVVNVNSEIKNKTVEIRKSSKLKLPDSIIAASALYSNLAILTADKAFEKVNELNLIIYEI